MGESIERLSSHYKKNIQGLCENPEITDFRKVLIVGYMHWSGAVDFKKYVQYCGYLYKYLMDSAESDQDRMAFASGLELFRQIRDADYDKKIIDDYFSEIDRKKLVPF